MEEVVLVPRTGKMTKPITAIKTDNGCLECRNRHTKDGYPRIYLPTQRVRTTVVRFLWMLAHGPIPHGLVIRHDCDNRLCVNIDHCQLGTVADNIADRVARGRNACGANNGKTKLTEENVREIRASRESCTILAARLNVYPSTISDARNGTCWKHVK